MDSISDEASNARGNDTPIILICSDRRAKSDPLLVKLFGIGVYNAILGNDRSIDEVCRLIHKPRLKKNAKSYYMIDSEDVAYQAENENDVSEMEIQNIVSYYKGLGKNEEKYVESFDNIAAQYNDIQLKIIAKFLPLNVKAVLEERSPKYQKIMAFNSSVSNSLRYNKKAEKEESGMSEKLLKSKVKNTPMQGPVVIPSSVNMKGEKKLLKRKPNTVEIENTQERSSELTTRTVKPTPTRSVMEDDIRDETDSRKLINEQIDEIENMLNQPIEESAKRKRGRPRKNPVIEPEDDNTAKRGRGRPKKNPEPQQIEEEATILPGFDDFDDEPEEEYVQPMKYNQSSYEENEEQTVLPGFDTFDEDNNEYESNFEDNENKHEEELPSTNHYNSAYSRSKPERIIENQPEYYQTIDLSNLLTADKKIASFVGTSKNGTSFIVNNVAELLSSTGINTAILDTTANRNSYYIYTKNEEALRKTATYSIEGLIQGNANGIRVNKNLTVYVELPNQNDSIYEVDKILETLLKNHSVVLIDCDFDTPMGYFKQSQETYLVQSMDILTIQPLTAFLRELKAKNILDEKKLTVVLNKVIGLKGVSEKTIIGGMAFYNDPAMSYMTELFDRNLMKYISIPFDVEVYARYLECIVNCDVNLKGYTRNFIQILKELGNMIYPLVSGNNTYRAPNIGSSFPASMNSALNQMKKKY